MEFSKLTAFLKVFYLFAIILLASVFIFIIVHEATHLILADEAYGICVGATPPYGLAYGNHNELSRNELYPTATGIVAAVLTAIAGIIIVGRQRWQ